jgi:hypothetical protein
LVPIPSTVIAKKTPPADLSFAYQVVPMAQPVKKTARFVSRLFLPVVVTRRFVSQLVLKIPSVQPEPTVVMTKAFVAFPMQLDVKGLMTEARVPGLRELVFVSRSLPLGL